MMDQAPVCLRWQPRTQAQLQPLPVSKLTLNMIKLMQDRLKLNIPINGR